MSHVSSKNAGEGQYGPKWGIWEIPPLPPCTDLSRITANATRQEEAGPLPGFFIACAEEGGKKQGDPPTSLCPACAGPDAQDLPALWAAEAGRPPKALPCAGGLEKEERRPSGRFAASCLAGFVLTSPHVGSHHHPLHHGHPSTQLIPVSSTRSDSHPGGSAEHIIPKRKKTKNFTMLHIRWH